MQCSLYSGLGGKLNEYSQERAQASNPLLNLVLRRDRNQTHSHSATGARLRLDIERNQAEQAADR